MGEGFFVNYDEVINHSVYHGKSGSMFASRVTFLIYFVVIIVRKLRPVFLTSGITELWRSKPAETFQYQESGVLCLLGNHSTPDYNM